MSDTGKVKIHNKEYLTVALRVKTFREDALKTGTQWCIATEIVHRDEEVVVMKASIYDGAGVLKATGHSEEKRASSQINKTSALENAETSAIGRALAALGYVGTEFASADEVANAITQQKAFPTAHKPSDGAMESLGVDEQIMVKDVAEEVKLKVVKGDVKGAYEWLQAANLEADAKVACWNLIQPAHIRTAITKYAEGLKSGATS
jgi:hypothetical protein